MNNNITLKEALNRQFVALSTYMPLDRGNFDCKRSEQIGANKLERTNLRFRSGLSNVRIHFSGIRPLCPLKLDE
ncbi:MAG: hypothetical protein OSB19_06785 [Opitutaceae bacterium]|nr:hypothetical protein [Opitutaceae bacterium]